MRPSLPKHPPFSNALAMVYCQYSTLRDCAGGCKHPGGSALPLPTLCGTQGLRAPRRAGVSISGGSGPSLLCRS